MIDSYMERDGKGKDMEKEIGRNYSKDYMVELQKHKEKEKTILIYLSLYTKSSSSVI